MVRIHYKYTKNLKVQIDDKKCQALYDMPVPQESKSLKSFLGLAGYFSQHIPNFAAVVEPLRQLIRKKSTFVWSSETQKCFEKVKELVKENVVLSLFDPNLETIITTQ